MVSRAGIACRHGPHQVVQKSKSTGLPFNEALLNDAPFSAFRSKEGAVVPERFVLGKTGVKSEFTSIASVGGAKVKIESSTASSIFKLRTCVFCSVRIDMFRAFAAIVTDTLD